MPGFNEETSQLCENPIDFSCANGSMPKAKRIMTTKPVEHSAYANTKQGILQGFVYKSPENDGFEAEIFLGVRYAKPPVGELRFEVSRCF